MCVAKETVSVVAIHTVIGACISTDLMKICGLKNNEGLQVPMLRICLVILDDV